jgi:hypothetical protein
MLLRSVTEGGVGLNQKQAEEVLEYCREKNVPLVYQEPLVPAVASQFGSLKKVSSAPSVLATIPVSKHPEKQVVNVQENSSPFSRPTEEHARPQASVSGLIPEEKFKLSSPQKKPLMRDIVSQSVEVGPVEELAEVTLTDLRYLAPSPKEAANRLGQKFLNLKAESILLYLDGLEAWHKSPLYNEYTAVLDEALSKRKSLANLLTNKQKIQPTEVMALVAMENDFLL